ncbi:MAG: hypothetical protein EOO17_05615 [Chloroflexi bacterium]|nr:MAG: hypothetical protein EOO17_05615 [Chloroflexota bacterium]
MKKYFIIIATAAFTLSLLLPVSQAFAQTTDTESITLSPVSKKYKLNAGQTIDESMTVVNDGQTDYDFVVYSRPYSMPGGESNYDSPNFTQATANADAYSWVQLKQSKFRLKAGESTKIDYSIRVPANATPGGHYGVIFAETQPTQGENAGNAVIRKKRVGSIIYATVNGEYKTSGEIIGSMIPFWQPQPPLRVDGSVKNDGNVDFTNATKFEVKDVFGNVKYSIEKDFVVLPDTTRKMAFEWDKSPWFGLFKVELTQNALDKTTTDSGYVLIVPRYLPVLLIVFILAGGGYALFRRKKR